ncbi:MAG: arginine decarboxylase, pyruvoyl-dependent [Deltaproteobacteria bacterium]|nr:arginine decarboxylase, pyruvoyl-dependent [Deltaproteobacteria bacterium]
MSDGRRRRLVEIVPVAQPLVPKYACFTKGHGVNPQKLNSFEMALRDAGISQFNLVRVSSIFPPYCKIVSPREGLKHLEAGQIVHCVMANSETNEPNRLVAAAVGMARPRDAGQFGYLSEHHTYGETAKKAGDYCEDLAATMLATLLGVEFDPNKNYDERKEIYRMSGRIVESRSIVQSAEGHKDGLWTTVVAACIFIC